MKADNRTKLFPKFLPSKINSSESFKNIYRISSILIFLEMLIESFGNIKIKYILFLKLFIFSQIAFSYSVPSKCQKWFLDSYILTKSKTCDIDCSLLDVNMSTFTCPNYCDLLCSKINCEKPPSGQCLYYSQCLENKIQCGGNGYAKGYGEKYCLKFLENEKLSDKGKEWRNVTMSCLQQSLTGCCCCISVLFTKFS